MELKELYKKLMPGDFSNIEETENGFKVERNYNSMVVWAKIDRDGNVVRTGTRAAALPGSLAS
jgi:hypothetical protein